MKMIRLMGREFPFINVIGYENTFTKIYKKTLNPNKAVGVIITKGAPNLVTFKKGLTLRDALEGRKYLKLLSIIEENSPKILDEALTILQKCTVIAEKRDLYSILYQLGLDDKGLYNKSKRLRDCQESFIKGKYKSIENWLIAEKDK